MAWKKPKWVQKAQTAASNVAKPVVQAVTPPPAPKVMQNIQKAADKVGNAVQQAPGKALQAVQKAAQNLPNPTAPLKSENTNFEFMPYFTKKLPDAVGDVVRGTGRALINAPKAMIGDTKDFVSGAEMVGRGAWDALKHTGMGIAPFLNRATTTTEPTMGGGRSGGAATTAIPVGEEDTDDVLPPGAQGNSKIGVPKQPDGSPIPPTPVVGSYLTGQPPKSKLSSVKMPKKLGRR